MKTKLLKKMRKRANAQFRVDGKDVLRATNGTKHQPPHTVMYRCVSEEQAEQLDPENKDVETEHYTRKRF